MKKVSVILLAAFLISLSATASEPTVLDCSVSTRTPGNGTGDLESFKLDLKDADAQQDSPGVLGTVPVAKSAEHTFDFRSKGLKVSLKAMFSRQSLKTIAYTITTKDGSELSGNADNYLVLNIKIAQQGVTQNLYCEFN